MAETNFFQLFKATWAQNGTTDRISAAQYSTGWAYIGSLPPTVEQFNAVQQFTDQKLTWVYRHLEAVATLTGRELTAAGSDAISYAFQNLNASRLTAGTVPVERLPERAPSMTVGAASKWETPRNISISGGATARAKLFDGSADVALQVTGLSMSAATGVLLPVNGGTGLNWIPPGNYLVGNGTAPMTFKTPGQVFSDLGIAEAIIDMARRILYSPAFTGAPTAPTPALTDNSTRLATTAFVSGNSLRKCSANALPVTNIGPVFVTEFGEIWSWVSTLSYTGYRSPNCGQIAYFATDQVPMGWLKANGTEASRTAFAGIFSVIGTRFGVGDGATTFGLPDQRGEFIRGWDDSRGVDSGRVVGSAQAATAIRLLIDNYVGYAAGTFAIGMRNVDGVLFGEGGESRTVGSDSTFYVASTLVRGGANDNTAYFVRPRNVALMACIKI
ncbi:phage tail protein [Achromobacter xylosoxidans]|uniref:phage tail protein n=1 Tax=Achromobacter ruhlandii TaxID=72557 RepID=UPI0014691B99|nr:phage tail protein [Achromobacter ruhlandii]CAB3737262.1 hypothetical protein LMG1866_05185 [Achromobacter ruhlandii]